MSKIYMTCTSKESDLQSTMRNCRHHINNNLSSTNSPLLLTPKIKIIPLFLIFLPSMTFINGILNNAETIILDSFQER